MEKVYKMNGYDLHLIPTNKFKNITISLKLQNTLDKETVTKRTTAIFRKGLDDISGNGAGRKRSYSDI